MRKAVPKAATAILLATTLLALSSTAHAEFIISKGTSMGTCADFIQRRKTPEVERWEQWYWSWAYGFMSGLNFGTLIAGYEGRDMSVEINVGALIPYCEKHPQDNFACALIAS
jgi:hypothetical protein